MKRESAQACWPTSTRRSTAVAHAGRVGMVGYCWGGRVTYLAGLPAPTSPPASPTTAVASRSCSTTRRAARCMFHFGEQDTHIPLTDVEKIRAAYPAGNLSPLPGRPRLQLHGARRLRRRRARTSRSSARSSSSASTSADGATGRQVNMQLKDSTLLRQQCYVDGAWLDADERRHRRGHAIPRPASALGTVPQLGVAETRARHRRGGTQRSRPGRRAPQRIARRCCAAGTT